MEKFILSNQTIENSIENVSAFLNTHNVDINDILRTTLALEDTLLNYRDAFAEPAECSLRCIHHFGKLRIQLTVKGESFDPFLTEDDEDFSRILLAGLGIAPIWQYKNGQNIIIFTPKKKKPSQMVYIATAVILALVGSFLSRLLPPALQGLLLDKLFTPVFDTFLGLLNGVAGMMIFLSVTWGICSIGDTSTLSVIGKKMISRMFMMMSLLSTIFAVSILPLFHFSGKSAASSIDLSEPFHMLLGIIPDNMLTPFAEGNFLQIIFIAAMVGTSLLILGEKTPLITSFFEQANIIIQLIMERICSFIPLLIFISLYSMILTGNFTTMLEAYKVPLLTLIGCLFLICVYTAIICISQKVRPQTLLSKIAPSFLIALSTASSAAALPTIMETCQNQLGIDRKIIRFGVPLGQIIFCTTSILEFIILCFCMAEIYAVPVTPIWIILAIFTSLILNVAAPPIPGGSIALYSILFTQLGIPLDGLAVAVAIDIVADFFITAAEVFCLQAELIVLSGKLRMLNVEQLRKNMASA